MGKRNSCHPVTVEWLGHFRVSPSLCFKERLNAKQVKWKGFALGLVMKVAVFGTCKWPIEQWAHDELNCGIPVEQNNPGYLKEFLVHNFSFSRLISKYGNVFLQFTTARLITIYDNALLQFLIAWLLQFSTTVITIYEKYYNFRKVLRFTTEQGALQGFWITYKFLLTCVCRNFLYGRPDVCF